MKNFKQFLESKRPPHFTKDYLGGLYYGDIGHGRPGDVMWAWKDGKFKTSDANAFHHNVWGPEVRQGWRGRYDKYHEAIMIVPTESVMKEFLEGGQTFVKLPLDLKKILRKEWPKAVLIGPPGTGMRIR